MKKNHMFSLFCVNMSEVKKISPQAFLAFLDDIYEMTQID